MKINDIGYSNTLCGKQEKCSIMGFWKIYCKCTYHFWIAKKKFANRILQYWSSYCPICCTNKCIKTTLFNIQVSALTLDTKPPFARRVCFRSFRKTAARSRGTCSKTVPRWRWPGNRPRSAKCPPRCTSGWNWCTPKCRRKWQLKNRISTYN